MSSDEKRQEADAYSESSSITSLKAPRTPRFAEATSVNSPINPTQSPFAEAEQQRSKFRGKPSDVGFGYLSSNMDDRIETARPAVPMTPLRSALKTPGVSRTFDNPLSPTFKEEQILEKKETKTAKQQKRDLAIKARVRMAKFALRGVNFSCSLIIIAMLATTFSVFNATRNLPSRGGFDVWPPNASAWPQILVLSMASVSLLATIIVFLSYFRGGHHRAEKVATYYTLFAIGWFIASMLLWAITAALYQNSRNSSGNKDLWGWACVDNKRSETYSDMVAFSLVCRLNNWALICIVIEIVVEAICITLYSIVFYRYWSKRRLHKSMDLRDKARTDLYLAQLRNQSAPNTPGFATGALQSPRFQPHVYPSIDEEAALDSATTATAPDHVNRIASDFKLQAPPSKAPSATRALNQSVFTSTPSPAGLAPAAAITPNAPSSRGSDSSGAQPARTPSPLSETVNDKAPAGDDEPQYEAVAIPGAYSGAKSQYN